MSGASDALFTFNGLLVDRAAFYGKPSRGAEFDFGGGYMFTPKVGLGVSFSGTAHEDRAGLGAGIGSIVLASDATDELMRTEGAVNIQAMLVPYDSNNLRVRVFGGPSYFQYKADMVYDFGFNGGFVTDYDLVKTDGQGWGAHVGGDMSYFFSRVVGIGGFARYSRAKASFSSRCLRNSKTSRSVDSRPAADCVYGSNTHCESCSGHFASRDRSTSLLLLR